jgi:hypothetical protein
VTYHKKCFTQRATPFPQDVIRIQGNDVAQRKDERVDVFHVEIIRGNSIRNGILRQNLRLFYRIPVKTMLGLALVSMSQTGTHGVMSSGSSSIG